MALIQSRSLPSSARAVTSAVGGEDRHLFFGRGGAHLARPSLLRERVLLPRAAGLAAQEHPHSYDVDLSLRGARHPTDLTRVGEETGSNVILLPGLALEGEDRQAAGGDVERGFVRELRHDVAVDTANAVAGRVERAVAAERVLPLEAIASELRDPAVLDDRDLLRRQDVRRVTRLHGSLRRRVRRRRRRGVGTRRLACPEGQEDDEPHSGGEHRPNLLGLAPMFFRVLGAARRRPRRRSRGAGAGAPRGSMGPRPPPSSGRRTYPSGRRRPRTDRARPSWP